MKILFISKKTENTFNKFNSIKKFNKNIEFFDLNNFLPFKKLFYFFFIDIIFLYLIIFYIFYIKKKLKKNMIS